MNRNQLQGGNTGNIQGWPEPCIYGVYTVFFGREITKYTVIYGVYIQFWPTLHIYTHTQVHARTITHTKTRTHTYSMHRHKHTYTSTRMHLLCCLCLFGVPRGVTTSSCAIAGASCPVGPDGSTKWQHKNGIKRQHKMAAHIIAGLILHKLRCTTTCANTD